MVDSINLVNSALECLKNIFQIFIFGVIIYSVCSHRRYYEPIKITYLKEKEVGNLEQYKDILELSNNEFTINRQISIESNSKIAHVKGLELDPMSYTRKTIFSNKLKIKYNPCKYIETFVGPGEKILIKYKSSEGIPQFQLKIITDDGVGYVTLSENLRIGNRNISYVEFKRNPLSQIIHFFKEKISL